MTEKKPLSERYVNFFSLVEQPLRWKPPYLNIYFMCLDAEWYEVARRNVVLSYQIATVSRTTDNNIIEYMEPGKRLTLGEVVELGICSVNGGVMPDNHRNGQTLVVLISHHTSAEWSVLADRMEPHITRNLTVIRKSPVTGITPIEIQADNCPVDVHIYDTRLLAPATNQKLSELSKLLGDDNDLKIDIPHYYKKRMNLFLRDKPDEFERYALQDSIVTLKLFFLLQESLMQLAGKQKLYRTLASAAVTGYLQKTPNFDAYKQVLRSKNFDDAYRLIKRGYLGGRNEAFMIGRSDRHPETANRLWVDVDFVGCYPTSMALCPMIDCGIDPFSFIKTSKKNLEEHLKTLWIQLDHIPLTYRLDQMTNGQILKLGVTPDNYRMAQAALHRGHLIGPATKRRGRPSKEDKDFEGILADISKQTGGKQQVERIRRAAEVVDNRHVDRWYQQWLTAKESSDTSIERHIIPGVALIRFDFQGKTAYPCLAVPHRYYGLIYPMQGETVATAPEIMLAMDAGAEIKALASIELPVVRYADGQPVRLFFDHLARLTKERAAEKRKIEDETLDKDVRSSATVFERLLKEFLNSFYGKTAQSVNYRKTYNPATGEMNPLGGSQISEASAASMTTGLARAALGAMLLAVEQFNRGKPVAQQIMIVSDTTDGVLLGLPRPEGINLLDGHYYKRKDNGIKFNDDDVKLPDVLETCGCSELMDLITSYLPIRQMRNSRKELTRLHDDDPEKPRLTTPDMKTLAEGNDTFLEIKNMADDVLSVKTRGQVGWIKNGDDIIITILAKFGHKPPLSEIVMEGNDQLYLTIDELKQKEEAYQKLYEAGGTNKNTVEGKWIMQQLERIEDGEEDIFDYTFFGLTGCNEIMRRNDGSDLVQKIGRRVFNGDFDWKRKLVKRPDGSINPISRPFDSIQEMKTYRNQMQAERRRGKNARPEKVIHRIEVRGRHIRMTGGEPATVVRMFLRCILQGPIPWRRRKATSAAIAERVNRVCTDQGISLHETAPRKKGKRPVAESPGKTGLTREDVENAKRAKVKDTDLGIIMPTPALLALVDALAAEFRVDPQVAEAKIFALRLDDEVKKGIALYVTQAVLQAPGRGITPFSELYLKGQLPDAAGIVRALQPHLTDQDVEACLQHPFHTRQLGASDRGRAERLLRQLGIPPGKAAVCARVLTEATTEVRKLPKNPAAKKCAELVAQALMQQDIGLRDFDTMELLDKVRWYGVSKARLYALRKGKFAYRSLSDTPANRRQITKIAERLAVDAGKIMDAVLDK